VTERADGADLEAVPSSRAVVVAWLVAAAIVAGVVLFGIPGPKELSDPDPAHQQGGWTANPGSWLSGASSSKPLTGIGLPEELVGKERFFVAFTRELPDEATLEAHQATMLPGVPVVIVANDPGTGTVPEGVTLVPDLNEGIAHAIGMRRPLDGGYPEGVLLVDSGGYARYATLDPGWTTNTFECNLVFKDVA